MRNSENKDIIGSVPVNTYVFHHFLAVEQQDGCDYGSPSRIFRYKRTMETTSPAV